MTGYSDSESQFSPDTGAGHIPIYSPDWDRLLTIYNVMELPAIPADGDPGSEKLPFGLKILREFCLDAANAYSLELWFDFSSDSDKGDTVDACWTPGNKGTQAVRMPRSVLMEGDGELGVFGYLLSNLSDHGMFAVYVSEFRDAPGKHNPWDKHGRLVPPPKDEEPETTPGVIETVTIRAFCLALKGHVIPNDLVIQICPRFWSMPSGFEVG
jgi:hypothetical protein